ncbi:hypothetical protein AADZ90_014065 [Aestuariibius sp. 2305UL40-4]|uniref:hypothetical protein n=1 Tax=Aestuariibius violaceus TaxID=3234132 RepID=UPI00346EE131
MAVLVLLLTAWSGIALAQGLPETGTRTVGDLIAQGGVVEATGAMQGSPLIYIRLEGEAPQLWICRFVYTDFDAFADPLRSIPPSNTGTVCTVLR